jgi:hypothetical protein
MFTVLHSDLGRLDVNRDPNASYTERPSGVWRLGIAIILIGAIATMSDRLRVADGGSNKATVAQLAPRCLE